MQAPIFLKDRDPFEFKAKICPSVPESPHRKVLHPQQHMSALYIPAILFNRERDLLLDTENLLADIQAIEEKLPFLFLHRGTVWNQRDMAIRLMHVHNIGIIAFFYNGTAGNRNPLSPVFPYHTLCH